MTSFFNRRQMEADPTEESRAVALPPKPGFDTVLGAECMLEGKLGSKGNVRLDGKFNGTLDITGNILVGETAQIIADINARNISIAGAVRGNVSGSKVQILRTGRVWGDITAAALTTEEGAFIDGKVTMLRHDASQSDDKTPQPPEPIDWAKKTVETPIEAVKDEPEVEEAPKAAKDEETEDDTVSAVTEAVIVEEDDTAKDED